MRVIFLNRFYWPDEPATAQLLTDLAEAQAARGLDVTVIASHPGNPRVPRNEVHRAVSIIRVGSSRSKSRGVAAKAVDFATFHLAAVIRLFLEVRRGDCVVAMTDPPLLGVGVAMVAALRGARLVHWAQDIYPELAIELSGQRWLRFFRPLRDWAWRRADMCVTLGADMASVLATAGVPPEKIAIAPNWAPAGVKSTPLSAAADLRREWKFEGKFVVAYSGNLGRVHDLEPVLSLAEAMRGDERVAFIFIGTGAQRLSLQALARQRGLSNVQFHPPQPRTRLAETLAVGDVHFVTVLPGCERYVYPSKLAGIAAVGRPVIFIGPRNCELARVVREGGFGRAYERSEISGLAAEIRGLADDPALCAQLAGRAQSFSRDNGGLAETVTRWVGLLNGAQACDRPAKDVSST